MQLLQKTNSSYKRKMQSVLKYSLCAIPLALFLGCELSEPSGSLTPQQDFDQMSQGQETLLSDQANFAYGQVDITIIAGLTVDADGNTVVPVIADPAILLYYRRTGLPVLAPDGHHVTAGEYASASGTATVKCLNSGTQVVLNLRGLIPHALYRIWILTFKEPGFNPTLPNPFINLIGEGSLGPNDRSRNSFTASTDGQGNIVRFIPAGEFSEFGVAPGCLLTDAFEWHIVGAFQQPGQPAGPEVGPPVFFPESAVEQFVFVFK